MNNMSTTTYTYHAITSPGVCINDTTMTIVIQNLLAVDDLFTGTPINTLTGGLTPSVFNNDLYNGGSLLTSGIDRALSIVDISATPAVAFLPAFSLDDNGNIMIPPGTPPATYYIKYKIFNRMCYPALISTATATLIINYADIVTPQITPGVRANNLVTSVDLQSNGKIIIAGPFTTYNNINCNAIARLNMDLTFDPSFDVTGSIPERYYPYAMKVIQNQGDNYNKILLGGSFRGWSGGTNGTCIARLFTDGSIDYTFNSGALREPTSHRGATMEFDSTYSAGVIFSIYVYPDDGTPMSGKILIGGQFNTYNGWPANKLALLNADGSYDNSTSFNTKINTLINPNILQATEGFNSAVGGIIVQQDKKIIVAGAFSWFNGVPKNGILRLKPSGDLDTDYNSSFTGSNSGFTENPLSSGFASLNKKLVLQPDGKLIVGGSFTRYNDVIANNLVRIHDNGKLDETFVTGSGFNNTTPNPNTREPGIVRDLILDTTYPEKIRLYVAGDFTRYNGAPCDEIIRIKCGTAAGPGSSDGTNETIGTGRFSLLGGGPNGYENGPVWCMKKQPGDGKIVIGGKFTTYGFGMPALNVTRILPVNDLFTNEARSSFTYYDSEPEIDLSAKEDFIIYPNPTSGIINFNSAGFNDTPYSIVVYNVMGQKVFEKQNATKEITSINLPDLTEGSYFISFSNSDKTITKTVIINK
jgi:uncharacterized delta-60 repeat protein